MIATFRVAESIGFKGELRQWEELLQIGDESWRSSIMEAQGQGARSTASWTRSMVNADGRRRSKSLPHLKKPASPLKSDTLVC